MSKEISNKEIACELTKFLLERYNPMVCREKREEVLEHYLWFCGRLKRAEEDVKEGRLFLKPSPIENDIFQKEWDYGQQTSEWVNNKKDEGE